MGELSALDVRFLVKELDAALRGGVIQKVYQYGQGSREFLFEVFVPGQGAAGKRLLAFGPGKCWLSEEKVPAPAEPPPFAMFLRKHFLGKRIVEVRQRGFDRIIEIVGEEGSIIVELMPPGNVVVVDTEGVIVMPLEVQHWKDRDVVAKKEYVAPPGPPDPFAMDFHEFYAMVRGSGKRMGALLATGGFGSAYANAICAAAGVEGAAPASEVGAREAERLFEEIRKAKPLRGERLVPALAEAFDKERAEAAAAVKEERVEEAREKAKRIVEQQEAAAARLAERATERRASADVLYSQYGTVAAVLGTIERLRAGGLGWAAVKERLAQLPEGKLVAEVREHEGKVVVVVGERRVELDLRKSVQENAAMLYEAGKQARAKAAGALEAKERSQEKLRAAEAAGERVQRDLRGKAVRGEAKAKRLRKKWYESFAWFTSSDGFLVVAGTSAAENERLVKTYTEGKDVVFHADIPGAGFVVVKRGERAITEVALKEASEFSAAHSRAWGRGLGKVDVFAVAPSQLSKTPPSGEYLGRGSFAVSGQRRWFRDVELKLAIGVAADGGVMAGPLMAVRAHAKYLVTVVPGSKASSEVAKLVKRKLLIKCRPEDTALLERVAVDEIARRIPGGSADLMEWA